MKRIITIFLIVLSFMLCCTAMADDEISPRASDYFGSYGITVSKLGSGKINFTMSCTSMGTASQLGVSSFSVQKYTDSGWVTVATGGSSYKYGVSSFALSKAFNGIAGEKYRVKCMFACAKSDGTMETKSSTSPSVTANRKR